MPDVHEIFRLATENVRPDPGALERQYRGQRWKVVKQKTGVYALVAGLVIAGIVFGVSALRRGDDRPQVPGSTPGLQEPTVADLAGIWLVDDDNLPFLVRFSTDGTYAFDKIGMLDTSPAAAGTYEVTGRTITFTNGQSQGCPAGDRWAWRAGLTEELRLHVVGLSRADMVGADGCGWVGESIWTRVSPSSPASMQITAEAPSPEGAPPSTESALRGIWLLEESGYLLRFGLDGTYAIDDEGRLGRDPDDVGTFKVDGRGGLTLTSGANSRTCALGDVWVWENVRLAGATLRGVVAESACPNDVGADLTWLRLSP